jgi:hypothetical protein
MANCKSNPIRQDGDQLPEKDSDQNRGLAGSFGRVAHKKRSRVLLEKASKLLHFVKRVAGGALIAKKESIAHLVI